MPGGRTLYIGTPHTHDSLCDEVEKMGADCLTIRMFAHEQRIEDARKPAYLADFEPECALRRHRPRRSLADPGEDYDCRGGEIVFKAPPGGLVDLYAGCAWSQRFDRAELLTRRRKTRTINEWDSQYQLHSKPVGEVRLDPERIRPYDAHPRLERANRTWRMVLGNVQIVSAWAYWGLRLGRVGGDASAFSLLLDDAAGNIYSASSALSLRAIFAAFADSRNTHIVSGHGISAGLRAYRPLQHPQCLCRDQRQRGPSFRSCCARAAQAGGVALR